MRRFCQSARIFCWDTLKLWWPFVCLFFLDSIDFAQRILHRDFRIPPVLTPILLWGGLVWAAVKTYHELRIEKLQLEDRMAGRPLTRPQALNLFLDGCLSALDRLLRRPNLTRNDLMPWRDKLAEGLRSMTGQDPMNHQREETIPYRRFIQEFDRIPSETHNIDFVREPLQRCRRHIENLRTTIKSFHFAAFEPSDLPGWEEIQ